ncbi:MAG: long-chain fatty acid--CoA ligase [Burkholderiaceae bacterium]
MSRPEPPHFKFLPKRIPRELPPCEATLWENLEFSRRRYPARVAIRFFGRAFTYLELFEAVESVAGWLEHVAGVRPGDRVILMMQNSPQFVIGFYAVMRVGAAVVTVNPMSRAAELPHYLTDPQARVALATGDVAGELIDAQALVSPDQRLRHLLVSRYRDCMPETVAPEQAGPPAWSAWLDAMPPLPAWASAWADTANAPPASRYAGKADDLVALGYTSGTTGKPKGCMHTHRTIGHNVIGGSLWNTATVADISLSVVPMFHITGMLFAMHVPILMASTSVILPRWDRDLAGWLISHYRVTGWTNIPTMVIDLLASPHFDRYDLSSLRQIGGGGAAMPKAVAERLFDNYGLRYQEGYGLTETAAPSHSNPPDHPKLQCLGVPVIGTDARIVDPQTLLEVPTGTQGEIVIHGPQVFKGYWRNPEATEQAFFELDGKRFFRSGDLGHVDEDGYFFITDRLKRMINASGFKVWPAEVENMLYRHPDIQEACIISTRDAYRGESVKAVVVLRPAGRGKVDAAAIEAWAREQMAAYKVPRVVEFVEQLPKSGSGKVMWRQLQEAEDARSNDAPKPA